MPHSAPDTITLDDRRIVQLRGPRNPVDPLRPYASLVEQERSIDGSVVNVATVFITNRECPFRCLMCDLWKNTTEDRVPVGAVAGQIEWALSRLPAVRHVKLYNAGNFFDGKAIPRADWERIAELVEPMRTVIVECHPRLIDARCLEFGGSIAPSLQVAMGLETVDPNVLPRLNKRMTLDDYAGAARFLLDAGIDVRAFILVRAPFQSEQEGADWARRSLDFAFDVGVECCALLPTRAGNGAMDRLQEQGLFAPPTLATIESVLEYGLNQRRGRVFVDLWDIERFCRCPKCAGPRIERLGRMNLEQRPPPTVDCSCDE